MNAESPALELNLPPKGFPVFRFIQSLFMVLLFLAVATGSVFFALGYRVNLAAGSIQQTGLLEVDTQNNVGADVYLNGKLQPNGLPLKVSWLFPGYYTVELKKDGYQTWSQTVQVKPNERQVFRSVLMIYTTPQPVDVPVVKQDELQPSKSETAGVVIQNGSELYINDSFLTRTSQDILQARWFPGHEHLVYQTGRTLWLANANGLATRELVMVSTDGIIPFTFKEGGRVLVYEDGTTPKAVALYDSSSFIDRLGVGRKSPTP